MRDRPFTASSGDCVAIGVGGIIWSGVLALTAPFSGVDGHEEEGPGGKCRATPDGR